MANGSGKTIFMAPSSIQHIHSGMANGFCGIGASSELERTVTEIASSGQIGARHLKIQVMEKDGMWYALNSSQLELCRRLEQGGVCREVRVDIVPSREVPLNVRNLIALPPDKENSSSKTSTKNKTDKIPKSSAPVSKEAAADGTEPRAPGKRRCNHGTTTETRNGYQRLGQEEGHAGSSDSESEDQHRPNTTSSLSAAATDGCCCSSDEGSYEGDTDSDIEWSDDDDDDDDDEENSSDDEWSNTEGVTDSTSQANGGCEAASDDDEKNCLL